MKGNLDTAIVTGPWNLSECSSDDALMEIQESLFVSTRMQRRNKASDETLSQANKCIPLLLPTEVSLKCCSGKV